MGVRVVRVRQSGEDSRAQEEGPGHSGGRLQGGDGSIGVEEGSASRGEGQVGEGGEIVEDTQGRVSGDDGRGERVRGEIEKGEGADRPAGRGVHQMVRYGQGVGRALLHPDRRHSDRFRDRRLSGGVHHSVQAATDRELGADLHKFGGDLHQGLRARPDTWRFSYDTLLDHLRPAHRPLLHRQRDNRDEFPPMAVDDRSPGPGQQMGEEHGEG